MRAALAQHGDGYYNPLNDAQGYAYQDVGAGAQLPEDERGEGAPADDQFTRLLNSLEARVDLMAQMQHTRAEIQKHTRNLQNSKGRGNMDGSHVMALPSTEPHEP